MRIGLLIVIWLFGLFWFTAQIPDTPSTNKDRTDAIVVLTGAAGRIPYGIKLLGEGRAEQLFISGVGKNVKKEELSGAAKDPRIMLGHNATSTFENAQEVKEWVAKLNVDINNIRLVTSNYHMPRSMQEMHYAMPDINWVEDAYIPEEFNLTQWWRHPISARLVISEYHKWLGSKVRHWFE